MSATPATTLVAVLKQLRLLEPEQIQHVENVLLMHFDDAKPLAQELVRRGWLTAFQVKRLSSGKGRHLQLGPYVLLDRLGEGGMGEVFKARHVHLGRLAALKVIRADRLANKEAIQRFQREIQIAGQLAHPNVVLAYSADEVDGVIFFAMEFVDGIDLGRLVKQSGPLPVAVACDYVRQAALGLQHGHERGLVHRDIKPANLLVAHGTGVVKLLDMGLARIREALGEGDATLTHQGKIIGTPDFVAPEQARNARTADIRSDLYSLGCTLFYLLTGSVPFPGGGTALERLLRHQTDDPVPIERLRPDVPEGVRAILQKLLAKNPAQRLQTPAELAEALAPFARSASAADPSRATASIFETPVAPPFADSTPALPASNSNKARAVQFFPRSLVVAGIAVAIIGLVVGGAWMLGVQSSSPIGPPDRGSAADAGKDATTQPLSPLRHWTHANLPLDALPGLLPREVVASFGDHSGRFWGLINFLAFRGAGTDIVAGGMTSSLVFFDAATLRPTDFVRLSEQPFSRAISSDGKLVAAGSFGGTVEVFDLTTKKFLVTIKAATPGKIVRLAVSDKKRLLATAVEAEKPARVQFWNIDNGKQVGEPWSVPGSVVSLQFVKDDATLLAGMRHGEANLESVAFARYEVSQRKGADPINVFPGVLVASAASADGDRIGLVTAKGELAFTHLRTNGNFARSPSSDKNVAVAIDRQGKHLAAASQRGKIVVWNTISWHKLHEFTVPVSIAHALAFSGDGRWLAAGGADGRLRAWNLETGRESLPELLPPPTIASAAFSRNDRFLAVATATQEMRDPFSTESPRWRRALLRFRLTDGTPDSLLADSRAEQQLGPIAVDRDSAGMLVLDSAHAEPRSPLAWKSWSLADGTESTCRLGDLTWADLQHKQRLLGAAGPFVALVNQPHQIVTTLYDRSTGNQITQFAAQKPVSHIGFHSPSRRVALAGIHDSIEIFEVGKLTPVATLAPVGGSGTQTLDWSPDGKRLAVVLNDPPYAFTWNVTNPNDKISFQGLKLAPAVIASSPDGNHVACCDYLGRLTVFDAKTGQLTWEIKLFDRIHALAWASDGVHLATVNANGTAYLLRSPAASSNRDRAPPTKSP
jgi:serine/threonine-protein kinase